MVERLSTTRPAELAAEPVADEGQTLAEKVYHAIRADMLGGRMPPGARLSLRSLATAFGVSMQPVRDAVTRLAMENALVVTSARAIQVPELSQSECDEVMSLRALVEGEAAALFAARAPAAAFDTLDRMTAEIRRAQFAGEVSAHMAAIHDWAFFVADGSGSPLLAALIRSLRLRGAPMVALALANDARDDRSFLEFTTQIMAEMTAAARIRDGSRMRDLRRVDILTYQRYLYSRLGWSLGAAEG
jgi:GntR family colanic acid and biofilm gene transcriptional regulator